MADFQSAIASGEFICLVLVLETRDGFRSVRIRSRTSRWTPLDHVYRRYARIIRMDAKPVSETRLRLAQMMTPNDANYLGKVFGGSILSLIDLTASAVSQKFAGALCVTAAFDRVDFLQPVEIGELVELDGFVSYVGRTSVEVTIQVHATNLRRNERRHVNTATVTMVNMADGKPTEVPRLICETADDKRRFVMGQLRRELHLARNQDLKALQAKVESLSESDLDALMAAGPGIKDRLNP